MTHNALDRIPPPRSKINFYLQRFKPPEQRFWERVYKSDGCWKWSGSFSTKGYGKFVFGKEQYAHRVAWIFTNGIIPAGVFVCHKCDNPICVNPEHLFLGTQKQNMEDMVKKGRRNHVVGSKHPLSKLDEVKVKEIKKMLKNGIPQRKIASIFGVSQCPISGIHLGKNWLHVQ